MKLTALILPLALASPLLTACRSNDGPATQSDEIGPEMVERTYTFEDDDARRLLNRVRPFFVGTEFRVEAPDPQTWKATASEDAQQLLQMLNQWANTSEVGDDLRALVLTLEHADAARVANRARAFGEWGDRWNVFVTPDRTRLNALVPVDEVEAFEALMAELDRPQ